MRHPEGPRVLRRLRKRQAALAQAMAPKPPPELKHPLGDESRAHDDRRQAERRSENLTGEALDARLRELGIMSDRRAGQRRTGGDRRRR